MLQLNHVIDKLSNENSYAIFTGDFNINLLEINTRLKSSILWSICYTKFLSKHCTTNTIYKKRKYLKMQYSYIYMII